MPETRAHRRGTDGAARQPDDLVEQRPVGDRRRDVRAPGHGQRVRGCLDRLEGDVGTDPHPTAGPHVMTTWGGQHRAVGGAVLDRHREDLEWPGDIEQAYAVVQNYQHRMRRGTIRIGSSDHRTSGFRHSDVRPFGHLSFHDTTGPLVALELGDRDPAVG